MTAKITFFFEKRKHFLKKSFIRCPIFQFHTSIECKGYEKTIARAGVTPLLKKTKAPECYPMTIGLGFRL